eukprot:GILJ01005298.1.p1 GENE.GILJ01005298.1~~GILJ01005298.1.p1  ORF type:complete len:322 (+),score=51.06 GILJ01005298.1:34-999(+)
MLPSAVVGSRQNDCDSREEDSKQRKSRDRNKGKQPAFERDNEITASRRLEQFVSLWNRQRPLPYDMSTYSYLQKYPQEVLAEVGRTKVWQGRLLLAAELLQPGFCQSHSGVKEGSEGNWTLMEALAAARAIRANSAAFGKHFGESEADDGSGFEEKEKLLTLYVTKSVEGKPLVLCEAAGHGGASKASLHKTTNDVVNRVRVILSKSFSKGAAPGDAHSLDLSEGGSETLLLHVAEGSKKRKAAESFGSSSSCDALQLTGLPVDPRSPRPKLSVPETDSKMNMGSSESLSAHHYDGIFTNADAASLDSTAEQHLAHPHSLG